MLFELDELVASMAVEPPLLVLTVSVPEPLMFVPPELAKIVPFAPEPDGRYSMTVADEPEDGSIVKNDVEEPE
jgi:hypothetical protein